jgi:MFS family permease
MALGDVFVKGTFEFSSPSATPLEYFERGSTTHRPATGGSLFILYCWVRCILIYNSLMRINRIIRTLLLFLFILNLSEGLFSPLFAVFVKDFIMGASLTTVGTAVALWSIAKSLVQLPLSRYMDRAAGGEHRLFGRAGSERIEYYAMIAGAAISIVYPLGLASASHIWQLYLLVLANGVGAAFLMSAYYGMFSHHIDRKLQSFEWSLFSVGGLTISIAIGAFVGGMAADRYGLRTILYATACLNLLALISLVILLPFHQKSRA